MLHIVKSINSILWGYILIFLLCGTGIYFTILLKGVQIRKFKDGFKRTFGGIKLKGDAAGKEGMSSFQALATAIAAQVGTGNLAGAATAIASGGPGAIFWMWLSAFFGMSTLFSEAILAQVYKEKVDGEVTGGPAYYIKKGLGSNALAVFFSISIILALGFMGNMVQSNSIGTAFSNIFGISPIFVGIILSIIAAFIFIGGIKRIASVTEKIVPIMAAFYIIGGLFIIIRNIDSFIPALKMIFVGAFNPKAATGGLIGATVKQAVRYGVARGLFSNEAGMGSTPHAHAVAKVKHPAEQGVVGIISVFIDTFIVLTITAFVILTTGALDGKTTGITLTQNAFVKGMGSFGGYFIAISLLFFAFSTIIGWYFFGEANVKFLFGNKGLLPYRILVVVFIALGTTLEVPLVWELSDMFNGFMVIPNLIALIALSKVVKKSLNEYENLK
ncbi:alanine or glycine:cation symporter, AGCS family [Caloramator quimbayensis]|uniref:Alanine or glycine:cation symporter, AGCS family n=1 Tax=Caloramator quimbayensis TaxID=1147123 RepID=A0A1T4XUV3_9CLOT|nr:sodium:alanine symporter family protein [Caloramator quimbayensis]SKA92845.1 alanine or glycine:cation symporter, AGCS family [Caloramator quimbayensis]